MNEENFNLPSPLEEHTHYELNRRNIRLFIKRDDLIHPDISGNKWRKLKWNLAEAKQQGRDTLLTLGGAHSNHIAATAAAASLYGLKSVGIIRGEDADLENPTLSFAAEKGMVIHKIPRAEYPEAGSREGISALREQFGNFHFIPQGGANHLGIQGCQEIVKEIDIEAHRIFVACGTATTLSGMALANENKSEIYGVSALKGGGFLLKTLEENLHNVYKSAETELYVKEKMHILLTYHFGGYAKITDDLIHFMRDFYAETGVKTDPIYTAKAAFGMLEMARKHKTATPENWVLIHSGGMQGLPAMESKMGYKIFDNC